MSLTSVEELYTYSRDQPSHLPPPWEGRRGPLQTIAYYLQCSPGMNGQELADLLGVSRCTLSHAVLLLTGTTLIELLRQWRLLHIQHLLTDTALPYADIAKLCGFSCNRTLSRFLERYTGRTAYEYRVGHSNRHRSTL